MPGKVRKQSRKSWYPPYKGRTYKNTTKQSKSAVMKRAGVLRQHMEPGSAMSRAHKDVMGRG